MAAACKSIDSSSELLSFAFKSMRLSRVAGSFGNNINKALDAAIGRLTVSAIRDIPASAVRPNAGPSNWPDTGSADPFSGAAGDRTGFYVGCAGGIANCRTFKLPANNQFGNLPIRSMFGPKFINQDRSLAKSFQATEKYKFSLRGEAFNAFNHSNLGDPEGNLTSPSVGKIFGLAPSYQMRRLQFALRLVSSSGLV